MIKQKRVCAIHDISCFGKCSLTVALPIISSAGIEVSVIPTTILSTHTGGFSGYTRRDLSEDILPIISHWQNLNLSFDALYTGYLGSFKQLYIVSEVFDRLKRAETLIIVDPVMADNGRLYAGFSEDFPSGMKKLVQKADVIVPNITEATLLLGEPFREGPYSREYIEKILTGLAKLGPNKVVLTGVYFDDLKYGVACLDTSGPELFYAMPMRVNGQYHGTGDIFASALVGCILNGFNLADSSEIAADFTAKCIMRTWQTGSDPRFGVNFEAELPEFIKRLGLINI